MFAHDRVAKSLDHGDLSPAHVDVLARADTAGREDLFADHEHALVDAAVTTRTVTDFEAVVRHWTAAADDIVDDRRSRGINESYGIDLSETLHGTVRIDGLLSPEAGALVRNALQSEPDPRDCEPRRSARQRRADRLVDLCRREITDPKQGRGSGAEILIHVDYHTLTGIRSTAGLTADTGPAAGSTNHTPAKASRPRRHELHRAEPANRSPEQTRQIARVPDDLTGHRPATRAADHPAARISSARHELDGHEPIRPSTVRHMACDGVLRRIVVDRDGEILDLGRRQRVVSDAQRRAVVARDRHCRFPGCRAPARNCQVHHLIAWADGGPTDLDNLCLACWHHHRLLHTTPWTLHKASAGNRFVATRPDGTQIHDPPDGTQDHDLPDDTQNHDPPIP